MATSRWAKAPSALVETPNSSRIKVLAAAWPTWTPARPKRRSAKPLLERRTRRRVASPRPAGLCGPSQPVRLGWTVPPHSRRRGFPGGGTGQGGLEAW